MKKLACAVLSSLVFAAAAAPALAQTTTPATTPAKAAPPKGFDSLGWLAGTRYIDRGNGVKSYETWTGPAGGYVSGAVASPSNGGLAEFFVIGPNDQGVYGLKVANTTKGLTNWTFRPIVILEPGKIKFADATGSFSIEHTPDGGIHNIATKIENGKETQTGEWFWLPVK
jgi:hypothetical protein